MKYLLLILLLTGTAFAADYDGEKLLKKSIKTHLSFEMINDQSEESIIKVNSLKGIYDIMVSFKGVVSKDDSQQTLSQTPSDISQVSAQVSLAKKFKYGVQAQLFYKNMKTEYDFMTTPIERIKSELGAQVNISLLKNRFGAIDKENEKSWELQKRVAGLNSKQQFSYLSLNVLNAYYRWVFVSEALRINKEILKNANYLLSLATNRSKRGVKNTREVLILKANISNIKSNIFDISKDLFAAKEQIFYLTGDKNATYTFYFMQKQTRKESKLINSIIKKTPSDLLNNVQVEIASLNQGIEQQQLVISKNAKLADLDLFFSLNGVGNKEKLADSVDDSLAFTKPQYSFGVQLSFPLGNTFADSNSRASIARHRRSQRNLVDVQNKLTKNLAIYKKNILLEKEKIQLSKKHMENEKAKYNNEIREYKLGARSSINLIQFQNDYLKSRLDLQADVVSFKMAINNYLNESDELLEFYSIRVQ